MRIETRMVILRWKYLVLRRLLWESGRLSVKAGNAIMFSSLSALDTGAAGQNVRLVIEKLGVMETCLCRATFPQTWGTHLHLLHSHPYCSAAGKPQVSNLSVCGVSAVLLVTSTVDMGSPSPTGTFAFYLFIYKASSVAGAQEMGGE